MYNTSKHIFLLIVFVVIISFVLADDSSTTECKDWQKFCDAANDKNNPRYKCIEDFVFYFESESHPWDKARQLCSQKFYGSYLADLMELSDDRKDAVKDMMSNQDLVPGVKIEMTTNGICCIRKKDTSTTENKCQWLSNGQEIKGFSLEPQDHKCQILVVTFDGQKFGSEKLIDKTDDPKYPYLCTYKRPPGCRSATTSTMTTPPTSITLSTTKTTTDKTVNKNSTECKRWKDWCETANMKSDMNNKCIGDSVFHFESSARSLYKAKQLCNQLFNGSHLADLLEFSESKRSNVDSMMSNILEKVVNNTTEMFTNRVCCLNKTEGSEATQQICESISNTDFSDQISDHGCKALLVTFKLIDGDVYAHQKYIDTITVPSFSYLCTYTAPEGCL